MSATIIRLSNEQLLAQTRALVVEERRITLALIDALREIERRMLFSELGYGSLFEFATRHLGLSEGSAQRRIQAMRLVRDVPDARAKLENGKLSLSNAAKVQTFCQMERKHGHSLDAMDKLELVEQVTGLSQRDCERKLYEISPQSVPQERERIVSAQEREIRAVVSEELYQKLERIRGLIAHAKPSATLAELLEVMADATLKDLGRRKPEYSVSVHTAAVQTKKLPSGVRIALPRELQRRVWAGAQGRCEFKYRGQRCSSRYRLEIDHRIPLALGGANELSNLRLLCRAHNQQQARMAGVS